MSLFSRISLFGVVSALFVTTGCSGPQNTGTTADGCQHYQANMNADVLSSELLCHATHPSSDGVLFCRQALSEKAEDLSVEALQESVGCLLASSDRSDGAVLAEALLAIHSDQTKVVAFVDHLLPHFSREMHENTFAAALSRDAQVGVGEALDSLSDSARDLIVSIALTFSLDPLARYCATSVQALSSTDPDLVNYAAGINQNQPLNQTERWALAATGQWDGNNVFECINGETTSCSEEDGSLELLAAVTDAGGSAPTSRALDHLRIETITGDEAAAITIFLSTTSYPNRANYLNTIMGVMTNGARPLEMRQAIASNASEQMCDWTQAGPYARNAQTSDPDRNEESAWVHFIRHCDGSSWDAEDIARALAFGSWLQVSHEMIDELRTHLAELTENWSCEQYVALANLAYEQRNVIFMAGQGVVDVANIAGDSCSDSFSDLIEEIAENNEDHPEGRLAAVGWLLDHDDSSGCRNIRSAMSWYNTDLRIGPTPWAEEQETALGERCH